MWYTQEFKMGRNIIMKKKILKYMLDTITGTPRNSYQ